MFESFETVIERIPCAQDFSLLLFIFLYIMLYFFPSIWSLPFSIRIKKKKNFESKRQMSQF